MPLARNGYARVSSTRLFSPLEPLTVSALFESVPNLRWFLVAADILLVTLCLLLAVTRRRGVAGTLAWIFAILAFPFLGSMAYLLLANPSIRRTSRKKRLSSTRVRRTLQALIARHGAPALPNGSVIELVSRMTNSPPSLSNDVKLLTSNTVAFATKHAALLSAKKSVWAEYYIIEDDETGRRFLEDLTELARSGKDVRLLYDAVGSGSINKKRLQALQQAGGRSEAFLPVNPLRRRWSVHLRNHRKILVIDGEKAFTGGMNVGNEYSGFFRRKKRSRPWRDTHLSLAGSAAHDLACIFAEDWTFATGERLLPDPVRPADEGCAAGPLVSILPSGPDQKRNASSYAYFAGISSARERVFLTSPYFIPDEATVRALETSALRGVDVRLLVPSQSDVALASAAAWSFFPPLLSAGVKIYTYGASVLHAKTMVVDGSWGLVGSANLDIRSFAYNFEAGALIHDDGFAREMESVFLSDLESSQEITLRDWYERPKTWRLKVSLARLLSPLL